MSSDPPKPSEAEVPPNDIVEENKCLMQLTQKVGNLKIELLKRGELIQELKLEKQQKELELRKCQSSIDNKSKEVENDRLTIKEKYAEEKEWKEKLKNALRQKLATAVEYQNKMTRLRNEVLSSHNLNDVRVSEEIDSLKNAYENTSQRNQMLQLDIVDAENKLNLKTEAHDVIDRINMLIKQLRSEVNDDRKRTRKLQNELLRLQEKIEKISNEN